MDDDTDIDSEPIEPGEQVFTEDGRLLGRVTGFTDEGFEVETDHAGADEVDQEELPGQEFGEGYLMWRCEECGEMGELDEDFPETCPNCGADREAITVATED